MADARRSQEDRILWALEAAWPNWVPSPELARISLQYNARIFSLRRLKGWLIENRARIVGDKRHGEFRLGSVPVPSSKALRKSAAARTKPVEPVSGKDTRRVPPTVEAKSLFGDITPDRTYRE